MNPPAAPVLQARALGWSVASHTVLHGLTFDISPGLSLVRGGDGRGKTTLLRLLAGQLSPASGTLTGAPASVSLEHPQDPAFDAVVASDWLARRQAAYPAWHPRRAADLATALGLDEHLHKPLFMLSTGSRRKLGLVAAAASGAALTLLDTPFAALDNRSCRVLAALLHEAADDTQRAWVLADHSDPPLLNGVRWATVVDLGD